MYEVNPILQMSPIAIKLKPDFSEAHTMEYAISKIKKGQFIGISYQTNLVSTSRQD